MNLPLPTPPTDNLYKFLAIAGLALLLAGILVPEIAARNLERDLGYVEGVLRYIERAREEDRVIEKESLLLDLRKQQELIRAQIPSFRRSTVWGSILVNTGSSLMILGFSLWYFRVQRYIDKILFSEATTTQKKLNPHTQ